MYDITVTLLHQHYILVVMSLESLFKYLSSGTRFCNMADFT